MGAFPQGVRFRRRKAAAGSAALTALAIAISLGLATSAGGATSAPRASHAPPYTLVLSNNFLGNDFRPQAIRLFQVTANYPPFKGKIKVEVVNAASTVQAHIASLNNIIQRKPDAILLYVSSQTALDPVLTRACKAGIVVVTVSGRANAPCAYNVTADYFKGAGVMGRWMAQALHGKGGVFVDNGLVGLGIAADIKNGFIKGLKQDGPNIKVIGTYTGSFSLGPTQAGISNLLVAHPDVSGIHTEGYCSPAFNALAQAGKKPVPTSCYGYNGEVKACDQPGRQCILQSGDGPILQDAMEVALNVLEGTPTPAKPNMVLYRPAYFFVTPTPKVKIPGAELHLIQAGKNYFPDAAPGFSVPYTRPDIPIPLSDAIPKR